MGVANFDFEFNQFDSRALDNTTIGGKKCPHETLVVCPATPYRSLSGYCNNVEHPLWGMALEGFQRLTHNAYFDGISMPRRTKGGADLPSVRQISLELFYNPFEEHQTVTEIAAYWFYFVSSDMANIAPNQCLIKGEPVALPCCLRGFAHADCDPIDVMSTDPVYSQARVTCIPHARTLPAPRPNCKLGAREQANQVSSFLDGSTIYGTSIEDLKRLRATESAKLSTSSYAGLLDLLPIDPKTGDYCQSEHHKKKCFQSGSSDVNLLPGLSAIHTLWFRQHNHVVDKLKEINRHWSHDRLFEEARKVVIAQIQHITYNEFLPVIIGNDYMRRFGLTLKESGYDSGYDMSLDASVLNEFASLAVPIAFSLLATPTRAYEEQFNNPDRIYEKSGLENLLKEMITRLAEKPGVKMDEHFRGKFLLSKVSNVGLDIVSIALKQGRDHGLPGYNTIRKQCGLAKVFSFNELEEELVVRDLADRLATIYETVDDIDLLVGVLAESPKKGSFVGPTLACIIANQFYRTRRGDRFWYENFFAPSAFTEEQLVQIRRTTLSRLICDVTHVDQIQLSSFMRPNSFENNPVSCDSSVFPPMDMTLWKDSEVQLQLPITQETIKKVFQLADLNLKEQRRRETSNIQKNQLQFKKGDPLFAYANMMRAKKESAIFSRVSDVLLESTRILVLEAVDLSCNEGNAVYAPFDGEISYYQPFGAEKAAECADQGVKIEGFGQWRGYYALISTVKLLKYGGKVTAGEKLGVVGNLECFSTVRRSSSQNFVRVQLFRQGNPIDPTHHLIDCMCTGQICETNRKNTLIGPSFKQDSRYNGVRGWELRCPVSGANQQSISSEEDELRAPQIYSPIDGNIIGRVRLDYSTGTYAGCGNEGLFIVGDGKWEDYEVRIYNVRFREDLNLGHKRIEQGQHIGIPNSFG